MNHFPVLLLRNLHAPCASQARWRALCEAVAVLLSKKMTCARPRRNATPSKHFPHTSHCTLRTPHSALHNCTSSQLISSELFSSHFMSSHMSAKFFLPIFMSFKRSSTFLISLQGLCLFVRWQHHPRLPGDHSLTEDIYELCTLRKQRNLRGNARPSEEDWSSTFQVVGSQVPAQII